jgi:hypothetical protein
MTHAMTHMNRPARPDVAASADARRQMLWQVTSSAGRLRTKSQHSGSPPLAWLTSAGGWLRVIGSA